MAGPIEYDPGKYPTGYECEICGRKQLAWSPLFQQGLKADEAKMIGWSEREKKWFCPMHTLGGKAKLAAVAERGLKDKS